MDFFSVVTLFGGLAFFLYGMKMLSDGLERMAGGKLESGLKKLTSNWFMGLTLGVGITAAIQSSSAVTVMLVGLVNSGIMTIGRSIPIIMGSNIGTTLTAWILTLVGVESDNFWMSLMKPENFSLIFAFIGILLIMAGKSDRKKNIGSVLIGFAILMYGMKLMSGAVKPLANNPAFTSLFTAFKNPLLGVLVGLVVTAVIQSSSASVGILQALALTGSVSYGAAIPIIMGQNIGTCVTAMISSMGVTRNAKKVAVIHIIFNLVGTAFCLGIYCLADRLLDMAFVDMPIDAVGIAVVHTAFNVFTVALLLPFTKLLERLANKILPDLQEEKALMLDIRLMSTPSVAIAECEALAVQMSQVARTALSSAMTLLKEGYDSEKARQILDWEKELDQYEDTLGTYLVQLSSKRISEKDSLKVSKILHTLNDFERLGDHAVNLMEAAQELHEKGLQFSVKAQEELAVLHSAIEEIMVHTTDAYGANDGQIAHLVEPIEQCVDHLVTDIKARHILRLQAGECSIEMGFILSDVLNNFERISDHCSNVAVAVIALSHNGFDTHQYLREMKQDDEEYRRMRKEYGEKYRLN
ncbi:MAG: Na/Pi cotransporter family protein [Oscillospiraceae bacterium]|nr:Na/Pi cotransporter family protein [Oscillospiraceae bacterium]